MRWFATSSASTVANVPVAEVSVGAADAKEPRAAPERKPAALTAAAAVSEAEQLDLLVAGARLDDVEAQDTACFLSSNTRHTYVDGLLSCAVYTFSGLQHVHGQSNALTLLTMWTAGTAFLVDAAERTYLHKALQGTLPAAREAVAAAATADHGGAAQATAGGAAPAAVVPSRAATGPASQPSSVPDAASLATVFADHAILAEQQRRVFLTQAVASWVWMLASLQQFKLHKRLKWCGYSSWMGLGCAGYYTTRHLYSILVK